MCQAVPHLVLRVDGTRAEIDEGGRPMWVDAHSVPGLVPGEYVMIYAGQALDRISKEDAEDTLRFYENLETLLEEASR